MPPLPSRKLPRLRRYDYTLPGAYFVTTITHRRAAVLGAVTRHGIELSPAGEVVDRWWRRVEARFPDVSVDALVVMPDHVHVIVILGDSPSRTVGLSTVVGWAKQRALREINSRFPRTVTPFWQRSFHERIIRDAHHLACARRYVRANPARAWAASARRSRRP